MIDTNELVDVLDVEKVFHTWSKHLYKKRKLFNYKPADETLSNQMLSHFSRLRISTYTRKTKLFDYEPADESLLHPEIVFRVQCFDQVIDKVLQMLEPQFEQLKKHQNLFVFLCDFQNLSKYKGKKSFQ